MNITELIVEFIQQGNVVEIPGIGTLTSATVSARHDAATGTYYPARRTVALSNTVSGNKAVVRHIAEKECVTNDIAEMMWKNFVDALDEKLQRNPAGHEFPGLGTLRRVNGKAAFTAVEGLDLDAGKKREQPIEHVNTYTPKAEADPFAAFDKPAAPAPAPEPEPAPAPAPVPAPEPAPAPRPATAAPEPGPLVQPEPAPAPEPAPQTAPAPAPEPDPAPAAEQPRHGERVVVAAAAATTAAELSELKKQLDSLPSSQPDPKAQRRLEKEQARAEKEARKAAEKAEKEARKAAEQAAKEKERAAKQAAKDKAAAQKQAAADELGVQRAMDRDRKAAEKAAVAEASRALKESKRQAKREAKQAKREGKGKRKHIILWVILIIVLLAFLFGGMPLYRYIRNYVPETQGTNNAKHVELPYYSCFSRDPRLVDYTEEMIDHNRELVDLWMGDYIRVYLNARHYGNAYAVVMERIDEYAGERLHELLGEPQYHVQRFFPFNDYYREYCYSNLQEFGGYCSRCRVQGELMDTERLDTFLDALISELGLHPDGNNGYGNGNGYGAQGMNGGNGPNGANGAKAGSKSGEAEYVEVVPSAPTLKSSKQGFDIIAGFCTQKVKADKMTNHLKSLGCDAYIINRSGLYYVSMGSAPSRTAAEALLTHIKTWYKGDATIKNWNE